MVQSEGTTSELEKILSKFYSDSTFLQMEISQKIIYNLYMLEKDTIYDINGEDDPEELETLKLDRFISIGRKKYGESKEIRDDFILDLERLSDKYKEVRRYVMHFYPRKRVGALLIYCVNWLLLEVIFLPLHWQKGRSMYCNY